MSPVPYTSTAFTYPGGGIAAGVRVRVYHSGTNALAYLYHNSAGTRAPNPTRTADDGTVLFYIEPGDYEMEANAVRFPVNVPGGGAGPGAGGSTYVHAQARAAATWTIDHNLGTKPVVTIVDGAGNDISRTEIDYPSDNRVVVVWGGPQAGTAYLRS